MEIALVARAESRQWLRQIADEMRQHVSTHQPKKKAESTKLPLGLPKGVLKDISANLASVGDMVIVRQKIARSLAHCVMFDFVDSIECNRELANSSLKIAFDFYGSGLLVWVETSANDRAAAQKAVFDAIRENLNNKYSAAGLSISLAYFTEDDEMPFPPQYVEEAEVLYVEPHNDRRGKHSSKPN